MIREGLNVAALEDFEREVADAVGPIKYIAMANRFSGTDTQLVRLIVFIGGEEE